MKIKAIIEPVYTVTPIGLGLERREYSSTVNLVTKLFEYQEKGKYNLQVSRSKPKQSKIIFEYYDEYHFRSFIDQLMKAIAGVYNIREVYI